MGMFSLNKYLSSYASHMYADSMCHSDSFLFRQILITAEWTKE